MSQREPPDSNRTERDVTESVTPVPLDHGVVVGDVTAKSAIVWTRAAEPAVVHLEYGPADGFARADRATPRPVEPAVHDGTVRFRLTGLEPATEYRYRVWALAGSGAAAHDDPPAASVDGTFRTAPAPDDDATVSFVWSGDTYGQGRAPPYQVPRHMADRDPDFFLYLGDTIYADDPSPALPDGEPETVDDYRAKYREIRSAAPNLRHLLASTGTVAIWDDHEVANDWAGQSEPRLPAARTAFFEYWPIDRHQDVTGSDGGRLYRSFQWGSALELFVLDTRQYRDENERTDGPEKTMLGAEQREWLKAGLADTDATFAVVASSLSLTSPSSGAAARDGWADGDADTGFEHELAHLVDFIGREVDRPVVWLAGDRHFARIASFDVDHDGRPEMYEAMATPIGAAPREPDEPDPTFGPSIHYQEGGKYALGEFYNFGEIEVEGEALRISVYDKAGQRRCSVTIDAAGESWPSVDDARRPRRQSPVPSLGSVLWRRLGATVDRWRGG